MYKWIKNIHLNVLFHLQIFIILLKTTHFSSFKKRNICIYTQYADFSEIC